MKRKILNIIAVFLCITVCLSTSVVAFANEVVTGDYTGKTVILHTNDVHGSITGYAKLAKLKEEYEQHGADVILADAGDYMQGSSYVADSKGEKAVALMNAVDYDVATIGNHEFDYGVPQLQSNLAEAEFDVICANVYYKGEELIKDGNTIITTASGLKVGFYGLDTTDVKSFANPTYVEDIEVTGEQALYTCAQEQIDELKSNGADVIISLTHLGVDDSAKPWRSIDVYNNTTGTDFGIDGHSHTVMTSGENGEPIQSTGANMANIGVVVIDNATEKVENNFLTPTSDIDSDETVMQKVNDIITEIRLKYGQKFAETKVNLDGTRTPGVRTQETNLGDLLADSLRWSALNQAGTLKVDSDHVIAVTNGGGIRASIPAGNLTREDILNVQPFNNRIVMIYLKGSDLLSALEDSTQATPDEMGGFPQVSGMTYTINTTIEYDTTGEYLKGSTWYYGHNSIKRVTINDINGNAFDPDEIYAVATNDFLASGGDTYVDFAESTGKIDTGILTDMAMVDYISTGLNGVVGEEYSSQQNRIHIILDDGIVTSPTQTEDGYTTYSCAYCDYTYNTDIVPALGNNENNEENNSSEVTSDSSTKSPSTGNDESNFNYLYGIIPTAFGGLLLLSLRKKFLLDR